MTMHNDSCDRPTNKLVPWLLRAICVLVLWGLASGAHAASVYKCVDAQDHLAFRDTPCAARARQTKLAIAGLPLIDHGAPRFAPEPRASRPTPRSRRRRAASIHAHQRPMSWECRAADGEVFYRHSHCPGSVPGDGVVRSRYAEKMSSTHTRRRHDAWSRIRVHGVKIPRAEACRRIHSAGAAVRDGHQRDDTVSTYDHLMGRDPCIGA